ncbi:MAG: MinD/ParA family protein [Chloroflexi bacterium]|nr:MinD/ParA family protein [Chloroflexota bacterium]
MAGIVSVHSFRGGTGKSNTTANLAAIIAGKGKRVGVIDTDIQSPGIHVLFGLDEEKMDRSLNDYLWGKCAIEQAAYDVSPTLKMGGGEVAVMAGGMYLIPCSLRAGEIAKVLREGYDVNLLNDGFRELIRKLELDYLFIDTHPGLNEETLLSITISDVLLIIMRPDQQDYQGTAVTVDIAQRLEVPRLMLVVNKALPSFDLEALKQKVESTYGVPVAGVMPESEEMIALGSGGLFSMKYPDHPLTKTLRGIAQQVTAG